jgi:hypothetical protein
MVTRKLKRPRLDGASKSGVRIPQDIKVRDRGMRD